MLSPDFELTEDMFDERTRLIVVVGTVDTAGVARVVDAAALPPGLGLVVDLTDAAIEYPELMALVEGLEEVRCGGRVLVVSPDEAVADFVAVVTVSGVIDVVTSRPDARAALLIDELLVGDCATGGHDVVWRMPVRLRSLDGVAHVEVSDMDGRVRLVGTSARWEARLYAGPPANVVAAADPDSDAELALAYDYAGPAAVLLLVVLNGDTELAAIDAHLVREVDVCISDEWSGEAQLTGTLAARVVVDSAPPATDP